MSPDYGLNKVAVAGFLWHLVPVKTIALTQDHNPALVRATRIFFFALLTGVAAWVRIPLPFTPVPVTLQTMVVLSCGLLLGRDGIYAMVLYLLLGGVGLPMFALPYFPALFGPTGGYLVGFVIAAAVTSSWLRPRWEGLSYGHRAASLLAVSFLIFVPGVLQLALWMRLSIWQAAMIGFVPFVLVELFKAFALAGLSKKTFR